jgi:hypothetical protein
MHWRDSIMEAARRMVAEGIASPDTMSGCEAAEINRLEAKVGVTLPAAYRFFLMVMGRGAGTFLVGTEWTIETLPLLQSVGLHLLEESGAESSFPDTGFVFASHQRYQFLFFDCADGEDPPVHHYMERDTTSHRVDNSFTTWLIQTVEEYIRYGWRENRG